MIKKLITSLCLFASLVIGQVNNRTGYYPVWSPGSTQGGNNNPMYPHQMDFTGLTDVVHFGSGPISTAPYWNPQANNTFGGPSNDSLNMAFATDWRGGVNNYRMIDSLLKYSHAAGAKLLLSMGGIWGVQAGNMDFITSDSSRTQTFVSAFISYCVRNRYDGVEIDYEPPGSREQMSLLTRITRREMNARMGSGAHLVITVANLAEGNYDPSIQGLVDQYFFMMYDMHNPYNGIASPGSIYDVTGFNAPSHLSGSEYPILSTATLNYDGFRPVDPNRRFGPSQFVALGFAKSKITVGFPFYGYFFAGKSAPNQSASGIWAGYRSYIDILGAGGTKHFDVNSKVPWINNSQGYFTFEDTASIRQKVRDVKAAGYGGVGIYELWTGWVSTEPGTQSRPKDPLLRALVSEAGSTTPPSNLPSGTFSVSPTSLPVGGGNVVAVWTSTNAISATLNGSPVSLSSTGTSLSVVSSTTFTLALTNSSGTTVLTSSVSVAVPAPTPKLLASYGFDEASGASVLDSSRNGNNGSMVGGNRVVGKYGKAVSLDGSSAYIDLGNPSTLQLTGDMTVSAWVKATSNPADDGQIVAKSDNNVGWQLKTTPDTGPHTFGIAIAASSGNRVQRFSRTTRALNTFYHVAGVYNSQARTLDIYVNGILDNGTLEGTVPSAQVDAPVSINVGRRTDGGGYYFAGIVDEVRIYNKVLTQTQIQADMLTPITVTAPPPPAQVYDSVSVSATFGVREANRDTSIAVAVRVRKPAALTPLGSYDPATVLGQVFGFRRGNTDTTVYPIVRITK